MAFASELPSNRNASGPSFTAERKARSPIKIQCITKCSQQHGKSTAIRRAKVLSETVSVLIRDDCSAMRGKCIINKGEGRGRKGGAFNIRA